MPKARALLSARCERRNETLQAIRTLHRQDLHPLHFEKGAKGIFSKPLEVIDVVSRLLIDWNRQARITSRSQKCDQLIQNRFRLLNMFQNMRTNYQVKFS